VSKNKQRANTLTPFAANKPSLLRQLSIASLVAMLVTATVLIFLYRQDQLAEHEKIAAQVNKEFATQLIHLLDDQLYTLVSSSDGLDTQALRTNPYIALFTDDLAKIIEQNILKVKVYNLSGASIYSSAKGEIGGLSMHPDWLQSALQGQVASHTEFRDVFYGRTGEMHDIYISIIYIPLIHEEKRIGVLEIYWDASPIFNHIQTNIIRIALIVFCVFAALYSALFFSARKADLAILEWKKDIAEFGEKIHDMAFYDALTRLPNRHLLEDRLFQAMVASKRNGLYVALMFMDLDNFKSLNDMHGHGAGDLLLVEVAHRISGCVREADTVARFGGDEFVVVLSGLDTDKARSTAKAGIVAEKIRTALAEPYVLKIHHTGGAETAIEHHCTSSIGMVMFIDHEGSTEELIKWADTAMYQAKEAGRNSIRIYEPNA
jgi:diguanylate cyclase (GGDEF)-like protein